jgi:hypothetical protein
MKQALGFRVVVAALGLGSAVAFGCYTGPGAGANPVDPGDGVDGTDPAKPGRTNGHDAGRTGDPGDAGVQTPRGMPCDVAAVVAANCMECHGAVPSGGAVNRLLTYEDFAAKPSDPSFGSVAELALSRMKSSSRPMPPSGNVDRDSLSVLEGWVSQGLPRGSCAGTDHDAGTNPPPGDDDDDNTNPPPTSQCTNGMVVDAGNPGELMRPGETCITCHNANEGPLFEVGGTIYPTLHEPDDCAGTTGSTTGTKVLIIDGTGFVHSLDPNASGNFFLYDQLPRPYRALVVRGRSLKEMETPQWNGDCNSCHTEWGSGGAPGRISIP